MLLCLKCELKTCNTPLTEPISARYRKIPLLGPGEPYTLICRTEVDSVTTTASGEEQLMNIKALNEWDLKGGVRYVVLLLWLYGI